METISNGIKASRPPAYRCDPGKAIGCPATACYLRGGPCCSTSKISWALLDEYGKPILSDDYIKMPYLIGVPMYFKDSRGVIRMETISNGIKASRPPAYRCDPGKAIGCAGTSCYLRGGPCCSTLNVSHALLDEYGKPIPSDVYIDMLISNPYKKQKFDREDIVIDRNKEEQ